VQPLPEKVTSPVQVALRQEQIRQLHAGEVADIIEDLDRDERVNLVESMDIEHAADALEEAELSVQTAIIRDLKPEKAADIIEEMEPAAAADLLDTLPPQAQKTIMEAMEADERAQMERLSRAEEDTAASLMTVEYIACPRSYTAAQAIAEVQRAAKEIESINYVYCLDDKQRLRGVVSLRDLILADAQAKLSEIMNRRLAVVRPDDDWEEVAEQMMKFRFRALPVVNDEGCIEGVVTFKHSFDELLPYYYKMAS
jgi:Mg/Co/Ni transporter MgtE